jgi:hypothetical protein
MQLHKATFITTTVITTTIISYVVQSKINMSDAISEVGVRQLTDIFKTN